MTAQGAYIAVIVLIQIVISRGMRQMQSESRIGLVWPALCRSVEAITLAPPAASLPTPADGEVTEGVTVPPAAADPEKEKARRLSGFGPFPEGHVDVGAAGFEPATPAV